MKLADPDGPPGVEHAKLAWQVGLHLVFAVTGLMLAVTDRIRPKPPEQ